MSAHYLDNLYARDASESFILEVDLQYPHHVHDNHSNFAFHQIHQKGTTTKKFMYILEPWEKYILHYHKLV